jgi:uncharacterized membrane protein
MCLVQLIHLKVRRVLLTQQAILQFSVVSYFLPPIAFGQSLRENHKKFNWI